jgi:subtilisin family serine protease
MKKILICLLVFILLFCQSAYADSTGVRIALIDTGISSDVIDNSKIIKGFNYLNPSIDTQDLKGHGTAVAGIIVGSETLSIKGVAPNAKLVPLVVCTKTANDKTVVGGGDILAQAIRDAIDIYDCKIINISAGVLSNMESLEKSVQYAEEKGVIIISSVGNDNKNCPENIYYPAAYDTVLGVSALKKNGEVASFTQRNFTVDICAPGDRLKLVSTKVGKTTFGSGTSYATAYVSGAAAVLLSEYPELTPKELRQIICSTADDLGVEGYDMISGWGALNVSLH